MIDPLGNVGHALSAAKLQRLAELYDAVGLEVLYETDDVAVV